MTLQLSLPKSNPKDLSSIRIKKQNRDPAISHQRKVVGIDTETENGNIFVIADSNGRWLDYPNVNFENVADFLLQYYNGFWVFFYNLGYDAECILKLLPKEVLQSYRFSKELKFDYNNYTIHYIDRKQLSIRKANHVVICYDIAQYYDNKALTKAYDESIGKPLDPAYLQTKGRRKDFKLWLYLRNKKSIRNYCIRDCTMTKELAEKWLETFYKQFGFLTRNWISSGYLAEKVLIYNGVGIPYFHEIPYEIQDLAWKSFYGGRFELIQRGFIGTCWLYDINSAYPHALTQLPDITKGIWISSKKIHQSTALGFFHIWARINDSVKVAAFPFRTKTNKIIYPVGEFETYVTLAELKAVENDTRVNYEILDSHQFIPNEDCRYPFRDFIERQYYLRIELKDKADPLEKAIKIVLNSMYGKMAQRINNRMGNLFSPVIASFITGFTRAQLYRFVREHGLEKQIVAFATDSVAVRKEIMGLDSRKLGEMKVDKKGDDAIFLSNGFYRFDGRWKQRGVGYDREKKVEIEHLNTRISDEGQLYIAVKTTRTMHVKSAILYNKLKSIGKIEEYKKKINLNSDKKRFWSGELTSLNDKSFCDSAPININMVSDILAKKSDFEWGDEQEEKYEPESDL